MKKWDDLKESEILKRSRNYRNPLWYNRVHGINYIASYCRNSYEMWKYYEPETIKRELGYAKKANFDSIRVYLNYRAWSEEPIDFIKNYRHFLGVSSQLGLLVNPVMFDGCGVENADIATQTTTVGARYEKISPSLATLISRGNGRKYVEKYLWHRIIPDLENEWVLFWEFWAPTPGLSMIGEEHWSAYELYCADLILATDNSAILAWDVMNEPFNNPENPLVKNDHPEPIRSFLYHFIDFMQKKGRGVPVLIGVVLWDLKFPQVSTKGDILCFHSYELPSILQNELKNAKKIAQKLNKPLLCNECLSHFLYHKRPDEKTQLERIKEQYEVFEEENIGWMAWHLIEGEMFLPYCGFIRRDGSLKPAAKFLKNRINR